MDDESELLDNLRDLDEKTTTMKNTKDEIRSILDAINFDRSNLTMCAIGDMVLMSCLGVLISFSFLLMMILRRSGNI